MRILTRLLGFLLVCCAASAQIYSGALGGGGGGGGTPGGSNTQCQYNAAGSFGGITGCTSNGTVLTLVGPILGTPASGNATNLTNLPITLTTTGTSGAATYTQSTSTLNIPQYTGSSPISGATTNCIVTAASATTLQTNTNCPTTDASGNISTAGGMTTGSGSSVAGYHSFGQGTATTAPTSSVGFMAPTSVTTKFMMTLPAAPATGFMYNTGASDPSAISFITAIPSATTATTQSAGSNDTKVATDAYVDRVGINTLTTTGTSGAATFSAGTLNIPQYTGGGASAFGMQGFLMDSCGGTTGGVYTITIGTANNVQYYTFSVPSPGRIITYLTSFIQTGTGHIAMGIATAAGVPITNGTSATLNAPGQTAARVALAAPITLTPGNYTFWWSSDATGDRLFACQEDNFAEVANNGFSAGSYKFFIGTNPSVTSGGVTTPPATTGTQVIMTSGGTGRPSLYAQ